MMKVAHVLPWISRNGGGLFHAVLGLAQATGHLGGMQLEVFGSRDEFWEEDRQQWHPLPVHAAPVLGPARLCCTPTMGRMINSFDPDLIHSAAVWTYQAAVVNRLHARTGVPYVLSTHGMLDPWALRASRGKKLVARLLFQQRHFKGAACIHALNDSELRSIRAYGLRNPVCVIPNGIDVPEIGGQRSEVGGLLPIVSGLKAGGRKVLLYLGRIHPKKGLVNLLGSWAETAKHRCTGASDWVLAIAGWDDGGHQAKLLHLCEELGLPVCRCFGESVELETDVLTHGHTNVPAREASVVFLGPQFGEAKHACYRYCDAFILPSFSEGLPMAVLEAWSFAKPVVMTPECNLPEGFAAGAAIRIEQEAEGKDKGAASRGETARSIEAGLGELFDASESRLHTLGENGRKLVADRFAWPGIARQMKSVYDWVLGGGEPPTCVRFAEGRQRPSRSER